MKKILLLITMCIISCNAFSQATTPSYWQVGFLRDKFGDETDNKYLVLASVSGYFNNCATQNSKLSVMLRYDEKNGFRWFFFEYNRHLVKTDDRYSGQFSIENDTVYNISLYGYQNGTMIIGRYRRKDIKEEEFKELLKKGGIFKFYLKNATNSVTNEEYIFKFRTDGFEQKLKDNFGQK